MQFDPNELDYSAVYKLLTGAIIPRPIGWISSISEDGINNLAPFSYFNAVGDDPPHVMFSAGRGNNINKDTLNNVLNTKQFVLNRVTEALAEKMNLTAQSVPSHVDEFALAHIDSIPSIKVKPLRVKESPITFECELVHDAQSGSGVPRLIRRTYEYIESVGLEQAKKTLFLFEITDPIHRVDMYCNEIEDYMIVNVGYKSDGSYEFVHSMESTYDGGKKHDPNIFNKMSNEIKSHLEKFHNPIVFTDKFRGDLIGLFSFLNENNIEYFYMFNDTTLKLHYEKIYDDLDNGQFPKFSIPSRSVSNIVYDKKLRQYILGNNSALRSSKNSAQLRSFTQLMWLAFFANRCEIQILIAFLFPLQALKLLEIIL